MTKLTLKLITFYQNWLSPDHSHRGKMKYPYGYCRFYPSCSEYSRLAIEKNGLVRGIAKSIWRIFRCNPFSAGGYDPIKT